MVEFFYMDSTLEQMRLIGFEKEAERAWAPLPIANYQSENYCVIYLVYIWTKDKTLQQSIQDIPSFDELSRFSDGTFSSENQKGEKSLKLFIYLEWILDDISR